MLVVDGYLDARSRLTFELIDMALEVLEAQKPRQSSKGPSKLHIHGQSIYIRSHE